MHIIQTYIHAYIHTYIHTRCRFAKLNREMKRKKSGQDLRRKCRKKRRCVVGICLGTIYIYIYIYIAYNGCILDLSLSFLLFSFSVFLSLFP